MRAPLWSLCHPVIPFPTSERSVIAGRTPGITPPPLEGLSEVISIFLLSSRT